MQSLVNYEESDEESDEIANHDETSRPIVKNTPPVTNRNLEERDKGKCVSSRYDDFFGLNTTTTTLSDRDEIDLQNDFHHNNLPNEEESPTNKVNVFGVNIELPVSEFWKNAAEEINSAEQDFLKTDIHTVNHRDKANIQPSSQHKKSFPHKYPPQKRRIHNSSRLNKSIPEKKTHVDNMLTHELRPIYKVHSKISPHLHSGNAKTFKLPFGNRLNLHGHTGVVNRISWCCDSYSHLLLSASLDSTVKVWNCWSQLDPCVRTLKCHTKAVKDATWDKTGRTILSCSYDRTAALTDVETGVLKQKFSAPGYITCGKFHPVQSNIIIVGSNNCLLCWDVRSPEQPIKTFSHKDRFGQVQDLVVSKDGGQVFGTCDLVSRDSADRSIMAWDFTSTVLLSNQIFQEKYVCTRLKLHPCEDVFLAQTHGNYIAIFSTNNPYKLNKYRRFDDHKMMGYSVGFDISGDGKLVCSGSGDGKMYFYQYHTGKTVKTLDTGWDICMDVAFHPILTSTLACSSWQGEITVWS